MSIFKKNSTVLFQGDSVTDSGRTVTGGMGEGYPLYVSSIYNARHPEDNITFINRGVGGNRTTDLLARWTEDCIDIKPDYVSILIGINDCWRRYDENKPMTAEEFESNYRQLLEKIKDETTAEIILIEPFVLPALPDRKEWRVDLDPKIHAVRELAAEYKTIYIPMDGYFAAAQCKAPAAFWAADGVHPTPAGHALICDKWLEAVEA